MLDELCLENLALIKSAQLSFNPGLCVITGETGSGKSALIQALKLLSGARFDKNLLPEAKDGQGDVRISAEARLFVDASHMSDRLASYTLGEAPDQELVISRSVGISGRSRVRINGALASVQELSDCVADQFDFCSQHEQHRLLSEREHARLFRQWAYDDLLDAQVAYDEAFESYKTVQARMLEFEELCKADEVALEDARHLLRLVEEAQLEHEGQDIELEKYLAVLEHQELVRDRIVEAYEALVSSQGALDALNTAQVALNQVARIDARINTSLEQLREAVFSAEDVASYLSRYQQDVTCDTQALDELHNRISVMNTLKRHYGPSLAEVLTKAELARQIADSKQDTQKKFEDLSQDFNKAKAGLLKAGKALFKAYKGRVAPFEDAVNAQLKHLEMQGAHIVLQLEELDFDSWNTQAPCTVTFLFAPSAQMSARPLKRIASGGEMSRVMLAIKVVLGSSSDSQVLIFDEIDAGVGGSAAKRIGELLACLSANNQVIVITHLAQIAALADQHIAVRKEQTETDVISVIQELNHDERIKELARMLAGDSRSEALEHARALLEQN